MQVANKLVSVCGQAARQTVAPGAWCLGMRLSTDAFLQCVANVTGMDLAPAVDQAARQAGHAHFRVATHFNRKRNAVELVVRQDAQRRGAKKFVGPVTGLVLLTGWTSFYHNVAFWLQ